MSSRGAFSAAERAAQIFDEIGDFLGASSPSSVMLTDDRASNPSRENRWLPLQSSPAAHGIETENVDTAAFRIAALNQTAHNNF
jgi:hypothetical protein